MNKQEPELLNINQVADLLNLKISKVRNMIFKREIPFVKIGRLVRLDKAEILVWIKSLKKEQL